MPVEEGSPSIAKALDCASVDKKARNSMSKVPKSPINLRTLFIRRRMFLSNGSPAGKLLLTLFNQCPRVCSTSQVSFLYRGITICLIRDMTVIPG